jgi:hypothetical protein
MNPASFKKPEKSRFLLGAGLSGKAAPLDAVEF